jgi:scyllo-inositol 2-dehydrogenase (NADP+)
MINKHPISTAILAFGMSGEVFHAPLLTSHPGFRLSKIMERRTDKARTKYPGIAVVRNLEEVLKDDTIELVIINTPHDTHFTLASKVLDAGKHVIIEKPFATTAKEGEQLMALAASKKLVLSIFQNRRWDGDFMTVQQVIKSMVLGQLVEYEAHYDRYRPKVDTATWKELPGEGSGSIYNLGPHMIDQALVLFGMPKEISARLLIQRPGGVSEDFYDIRMMYDTLHVILKSSYLVREPGPRYILHGVNGSFIKYGLDTQEQALKDGMKPGGINWGKEPSSDWGKINAMFQGLPLNGKIETTDGNYLLFYQNIYEAIREQKELAVSPLQALQVMQIIDACVKSNREKRTILL